MTQTAPSLVSTTKTVRKTWFRQCRESRGLKQESLLKAVGECVRIYGQNMYPGQRIYVRHSVSFNGCLCIKGRIIRLDELGQTFVVRLLIRLQCKDGHKTHFPSRRTTFCRASFKSHNSSSSGWEEGKHWRALTKLCQDCISIKFRVWISPKRSVTVWVITMETDHVNVSFKVNVKWLRVKVTVILMRTELEVGEIQILKVEVVTLEWKV